MNRRRRQSGQSLVLAALLITALIGFVGLVVDGGEASNEQQIVRSAADGAALAGAYAIAKGSATTAATTRAQQVLLAVPLPAADLTMSYLDSGGSPTTITASVVTIRAVVADSHRTYFLAALGVATLLLTATAEARNSGAGASAPCAVCLMVPAGTTLTERNNDVMTITGGPLQVNSSGTGAFTQSNGASLTAPSIAVVGTVVKGTGTITPAPVTGGSAIADPLAAIVVPAVVGASSSPTAPAGASALAPGVYGTVTVNAGSTLTFSPGTFVITGQLNVNGGSVIGTGVTIFLGCPLYPTACAVGAGGGYISATTGSSLTLSPPAAGTYSGLTVFADRNNVATDTLAGSTVNVSGTWYALLQPLTDTKVGDSIGIGQLVAGSLEMANNSTFNASRSATTSYGTGSASIGLTL
jgi:Putative Flp pilus-assembly TadE/G-like